MKKRSKVLCAMPDPQMNDVDHKSLLHPPYSDHHCMHGFTVHHVLLSTCSRFAHAHMRTMHIDVDTRSRMAERRQSRPNTVDEKRKMRNNRKR